VTLRRIYVLTIISSRGPIGPKTRDRFFNSFVVLAPPPQPQPIPNPEDVKPPHPRPPRPKPPAVEPPGPGLGTPVGPIEAGGEVRALAFAPDGRTLAVAVEESGVDLWEVSTLRLRARATLPVDVQTSVVYTPDGSRLAVGGGPGLGAARRGHGGEDPDVRAVGGAAGFGVRLLPDGKRLAAASGSPGKPIVRVWELATGEGRDVLRYENAGLERMRHQGVAFAPDGSNSSSLLTGPARGDRPNGWTASMRSSRARSASDPRLPGGPPRQGRGCRLTANGWRTSPRTVRYGSGTSRTTEKPRHSPDTQAPCPR
jgi:hypothetical protein